MRQRQLVFRLETSRLGRWRQVVSTIGDKLSLTRRQVITSGWDKLSPTLRQVVFAASIRGRSYWDILSLVAGAAPQGARLRRIQFPNTENSVRPPFQRLHYGTSHVRRRYEPRRTPRHVGVQEGHVASRQLHDTRTTRRSRRDFTVRYHYVYAIAQIAKHIFKILKRLALGEVVGVVVPVADEAALFRWPICV